MKERPLTSGEIAEYCHVTHRAVLQWISSGKIKAYRTPGQHTRVKIEDFIIFLKAYSMPIPDEFKKGKDLKRILIVDDDKGMADALRRVLILEKKYEIQLAYNGFDAGRKIVEFSPHLVILDIKMPGMDGYEVACMIKGNNTTADSRIIAISAFFEENLMEKLTAIGVDACLDKPFDSKLLLDSIDKVLS